jgi:small subunit ribosomal protein S16
MAVVIRMARAGAKKQPHYRIVAADKRSSRDGKFLEKLGTYDPRLKKDDPKRVQLNVERIEFWMKNGAVPSERVARFLGAAKVRPMPEHRKSVQKALPKAKAQERLKQREEKAKAAAEASAKPAEAPAQG